MTGKFKSGAKTVGRGFVRAMLPVQAWRSVQESGKSLVRIGRMIRDRKVVPFDEEEPSAAAATAQAAVEKGREIVLALPEHERFEYFYCELGWTEDALHDQKKAIARSHAIRLSMLMLVLLLCPALLIKFGPWTAVYCLAAASYLATICIKAACFHTQIEERAMWSFSQLRARPQGWLWKHSFWFLE